MAISDTTIYDIKYAVLFRGIWVGFINISQEDMYFIIILI